nr:MAG TPA: hypothetical protein [Caudoviricetes sp.]
MTDSELSLNAWTKRMPLRRNKIDRGSATKRNWKRKIEAWNRRNDNG